MIVQAIGLLDELDKEINTYAMRVKEWFGWHFPEMAKVGSTTSGVIALCLTPNRGTFFVYFPARSFFDMAKKSELGVPFHS